MAEAGMKVLHLSTYPRGGAANAAIRLHQSLLTKGIESIFAVKSDRSAPSEYRVAARYGLKQLYAEQAPRLEYHFAKWRWPGIRPVLPSNLLPGVCRGLIRSVNPDIIHLHWVEHNMFSIADLRWLRDSRSRIVWTLHDMNPLSGGVGFRETLGLPPDSFGSLVCTDRRRGLSENILNRRREALTGAAIQVVAPSSWLTQEARLSPVFNSHPVTHIPYGIDTNRFRPLDPDTCRKKWDLPEDRPIILFGADAFHDKRKGLHHLFEALKLLSSPPDRPKPLLVGFGNAEPIGELSGIEAVGLGRIESESELASLYNAANLFVCPSREDNLPNTVLESLACGTPVVGFRVGGLPDLVIDHITGLLVEPFDNLALGHAISKLLALDLLERGKMKSRCRELIAENFTLGKQADSYMKIYEALL